MPLAVTVVILSGVLGGLFGTFIPRLAYRLSVSWGTPPRTTCSSCSAPLRRWFSCRECEVRLGPSPWWTVPAGALCAAVLAAAAWPNPWATGAMVLVSGLGVLLAAIDLAVYRLPDPLVATAAVTLLLLLALGAWYDASWADYRRAVLCGLILFAAYGVLALISAGQLGLGDVKLAAVLGFLLGWFGWQTLLVGAFAGLLLNGAAALILLLLRRITLRGHLPMGPSMLAGALPAVLIGLG